MTSNIEKEWRIFLGNSTTYTTKNLLTVLVDPAIWVFLG